MNIIDSKNYQQLLKSCSVSNIKWNELSNKSLLITGCTGLIGSFLIDLLMYQNINNNSQTKIYAVGRSKEKIENRFKNYLDSPFFAYLTQSIQEPFSFDKPVDYLIHAASNSHPVEYATDPIGTITTNVFGTYNILEYATKMNIKKVLFLSSVEIYGVSKDNIEEFDETYSGYIDCSTLRAGYPESKRVAESLCASYISKNNLNIVIARLCRIFGPTMQMDDSKVVAQFIKNAINNQNIVLKSNGEQYYSYLHVADAVVGLLICLINGKNGEVYNVSDKKCDSTILNMANILAQYRHKKVIFELPNEIEKKGFSKATSAILKSSKINNLGFSSKFSISDALINTIDILEEIKSK